MHSEHLYRTHMYNDTYIRVTARCSGLTGTEHIEDRDRRWGSRFISQNLQFDGCVRALTITARRTN